MNAYEITCILRPDLDDEQTRALAMQVVSRVETVGGEVVAHYPWSPARRRMAYPIHDFGDGFYFTATFNVDSPALTEIERTLRLNDRILRFLIVQASEQMIKQSQQRMQQSEAAAKAPPTGAPTPAQTSPPVQEAAPATDQTAAPDGDVETALPAGEALAETEPVAEAAAPVADVEQTPVVESVPAEEITSVDEQTPVAEPAGEETPAEPVASAPAPAGTEE